MNAPKPNKQYNQIYTYLPAVDCLRFFVFLMILANHTNINKQVNGHSFFFTLTGFLISYISIAEIRRNNSFNLQRYLARRFLRTLPLFFLIVFLSFGFAILVKLVFHKSITTGPLWPYLLLIQNFFEQDVFFPLANLWAMGVTEQYYLLLGILFFLFYKQLHWFGWLICFCGLAVNCISFFGYHTYSHTYSWYFLINFGIGNLLAVFCLDKGRWFQKLSVISFNQTILFYAAGLVLLVFGFFYPAGWFIPFRELVLSSGYCFLIFNLGFGSFKPFQLDKAGYLQNLGKRTLGFYCWHAPVLTMLEKSSEYFNVTLNRYLLFVLVLLVCLPLVNLSYKYFEQRFIALKERFN
jgi:peptidoglycan/LPS O-acetylase OafA/YrhL